MTRAIKLVLQALAVLFGNLAIVFAVVAWRLSAGPISLAFLSPYLAQAFEAEDLSYHVEFSDTILTWAGWNRSLDILVRGVKVIDDGGKVLGTLPELSVGLSGLQLLRGRVTPTVIELLRPEVVLHRARDGSVRFGFGGVNGSGASDPAFKRLLAGVMAPRDPERPLGLLRQVSVRDADVTFEDEDVGLILHAQVNNIVLDRDPRGLVGHLDFVAQLGDVVLPISGDAVYVRETSTIDSELRVNGLNPAQLASMIPELDELKAVDLPLSGKIGVALSAEGQIGKTTFDLTADRGRLGAPGVLPEALDVVVGYARGEISADRTELRVDDMFVDLGGPSAEFSGLINETPEGTGLDGKLVLLDVPIDDLNRFWPETIAPGVREWVLANANAGVMRRFAATMKMPPERLRAGGFDGLKPGELAVDYEFSGTTFNYLKGLPKVTGIDGVGHSDGLNMTVTMRDGMLGNIQVIQSTSDMRGLTGTSPMMSMVAELDGEARDILEILDTPRLGYVKRAGLRPDQVKGHVRGQMGAQFLMLKRLKAEEVALSAKASVDALAVDGLISDFKASDGVLSVSLDSASGMDVSGTIKIEGVPAEISWRENFSAKAPFLTRYDVSAVIDDAARQRLGISLSRYLDGPVPTVIRYTDVNRKRRYVSAVLDMKEAALALPELNWLKPVGEAANLSIELLLPKQGDAKISNFVLQGKDARIEGNGALDVSLGRLTRLDITRMLLGQTDAAAHITPAANTTGAMEIAVTGESLDVRPYLDDIMRRDEEPVTDLDLDINVKHLITRVDQQLTTAHARLVFGDKGLKTVFLDGTLASGAPLRLRLEPNGVRRRLLVESDDAGSVARAFGIFDNAIGGKLRLEATIFDEIVGAPVEGNVKIDTFKVRNASTLANILAFASLTGIGDVMRGEGLSFDHFDMPFTVVDNLVTIKDARTSGAALGVTASGTVKLDNNEANIKGTIVPAYAVNSLLGNIPVIGDLLTGGEEGGGVFAAAYTVQGPIEAATITVNPLAALAPGFLRNLFSIFDGASEPGQEVGKMTEPPKETDR